MRDARADHCDRTMLDAGRNSPEPGSLRQFDDLPGLCIGGNVDIRHWSAKQRVAHASTHEKRLCPG